MGAGSKKLTELLLMILQRANKFSDKGGGQAALECAVWREDIELVNHLIESGVNPSTPGRGIFGVALQSAVSSKNNEIVNSRT
jgi:hypothetical protein